MFSCTIYLRNGVVYIPTWGQVENRGPYRAIEPVSVVAVSDTAGLRRALRETIARGNPILPHLLRAQLPPPFLHKYAGLRDWSTFARTALAWDIGEWNGVYEIAGMTRTPRAGWGWNPEQTITMPPGSTVDEMIDRLIPIMQEAARKQRSSKTVRGKHAPDQDGREN